ncbi:hypothetical protein ACFFRR_000557 [Megaselia abdita]
MEGKYEINSSKTYHYRKVTKPLLERKRRARINKCLDQLKTLMVDCLTQEGEHITRLEKADILELTVEYLRKQKKEKKTEAAAADSFRNGYINAANEVSRVLATVPGVDIALGKNIMTHLGGQLNNLQQQYLTHVEQQQQCQAHYMTPLTIDTPMSPASSGYHSDLASPSESENGSSVWRPW